MIKLSHVCKSYKAPTGWISALNDINLEVKAGEIFGVIGSSGAGKSTLIRCVNLLERPTQGEVWVNEQALTPMTPVNLRAARQHIGMIFQHFNLLSNLTVYNNIALPLRLASKCSASFIEARIRPLLELTGLLGKEHYYPAQLSGGQKQRVAIARALINKPKVLLSDEATSALDPETTHSILKLLKQINQELGLTILLITHEIEVIKEICHRLAMLERGRIIEQSNVVSFFNSPKTHIARSFIRHSLEDQMPEMLKARLIETFEPGAHVLLRITFLGVAAEEPLIALIIQKFNLKINILQAKIEQIRDELVGIMMIEVDGEQAHIDQSIHFLLDKGMHVEAIGYAKPNR